MTNERVAVWNRNTLLCDRARVARTPKDRRSGLLGAYGLYAGEGLLITPCSAIHTVGMRFPIDVVFADANGCVLLCGESIAPGHQFNCLDAVLGLELPAGMIESSGTQAGDFLRFDYFTG